MTLGSHPVGGHGSVGLQGPSVVAQVHNLVQVALGRYLGVHGRERALLGHLEASVRRGRSCLQVPTAGGGNGTVCLLPCHRWNYCHDDQSCCTSPRRLPLALTTREQLQRAGVAVLHQVPCC